MFLRRVPLVGFCRDPITLCCPGMRGKPRDGTRGDNGNESTMAQGGTVLLVLGEHLSAHHGLWFAAAPGEILGFAALEPFTYLFCSRVLVDRL